MCLRPCSLGASLAFRRCSYSFLSQLVLNSGELWELFWQFPWPAYFLSSCAIFSKDAKKKEPLFSNGNAVYCCHSHRQSGGYYASCFTRAQRSRRYFVRRHESYYKTALAFWHCKTLDKLPPAQPPAENRANSPVVARRKKPRLGVGRWHARHFRSGQCVNQSRTPAIQPPNSNSRPRRLRTHRARECCWFSNGQVSFSRFSSRKKGPQNVF